MSRFLPFIAAAALALAVAAPASAQGKFPKGECLQKNTKQENAERKACNDKHGTTVTPERTKCFEQVRAAEKERREACMKLPDKG
jgi:hypothetical protein